MIRKSVTAPCHMFFKNIVQIWQETSYRGLFDKIRNEMASIAPLQNPQAEGDLDMEVLNGKALANADYYKVLSVIALDQVYINAGQLHNLFENSKVAFYPVDTRDIENQGVGLRERSFKRLLPNQKLN